VARLGSSGAAAIVVRVRARLDVIGVVTAGGALGALARHGAVIALGAAPMVTFAVNVFGCLLIGALTALMREVWAGHRLLRPFLGTGLLGGFTTFSGYALDAQRLLAGGRTVAALVYLAGTVATALVAVYVGMALTSAMTKMQRRH
jgi:CrcB protein